MEKIIDVTVGYKIVEDGKPTRYFAGCNGEGMCYKDLDAYKSNTGICYISECEFDEGGWAVSHKEGLGYTREEILDHVSNDAVWNWELPIDHDFEERIADYLIESVEWESIGVALDRIDLDEEWESWQSSK